MDLPAPMIDFNVKLCEPSLVRPADHQLGDNNNHDVYFLSNLDQDEPFIVETLFAFKAREEMRNKNPAKIIREALRKVLVFYYPLAGRLNTSPEGRLYVQCTGEGAVFVEARTECCIDDIASDFAKPDFRTLRRLVYGIPGANTNILLMPPLVVQVTIFKCGGFVLGVSTNHILFDGLSTTEFLKSWAEIARGAVLSVPPFLDRALLRARSPLTIEFHHLEYSTTDDVAASKEILNEKAQYEYRYFSFNPENIEKLKMLAMEDGTLGNCTGFQALSSHVWRCRTKALGIPPDQQVQLFFAVDVRRRLKPPLPKGYFGNAIHPACSICSARQLLENGPSFGVGLIQNAIETITDRYVRSAIDYLEGGPQALPVKNTLEITTWTRIPFNTVDFGWGEPVQNGPASPPPHKDFVIFLSHANKKSTNVLVGLPPRCMMLFEEYIHI